MRWERIERPAAGGVLWPRNCTLPAAGWKVGVDLGQRRDASAIAVCRRRAEVIDYDAARWAYRLRWVYELVHLERLPSDYDYVAQAVHIGDLLARREFAGGVVDLLVDATGVGLAVVDYLRYEIPRGVRLRPVVLTGGAVAAERGGGWTVPKLELVQRLAVMVESEDLAIAAGLPLLPSLEDELRTFRYSRTATGRETASHGRSTQHDDLVIAVGLAVWDAGGDAAPVGLRGDGRLV